ncbi:GNAT family N-acetyltransferase [Flagellimonas lutimaris]|uniref:GNAT family N-acetyltransferase n=1 Tax=Flagellimonas lutimaris TaxID=475082 RepID=A0A3A1NC23_9FLAO|nr:GNAT family N-acetyltransferase [Allomuricauda lutimaris]RIV35419.1 GNAT family N-acetyltransferase [Allomuricauda lutimaris]
MNTFKVDIVQKSEYPILVEVWEASVRATHDFLKEEDIRYFRPLILNTYLDAVELRCARDGQGIVLGFLGVADHNLEMLFIHPDNRGMGIGRKLLDFAIDELEVQKVDVNEQNKQAVGFYEHYGFEVIGRSALDASGKPYPILHMKLKSNQSNMKQATVAR